MPLAVIGNQGACVIAKSYEMKAAGVKTGEPIWDAVKKCPEGAYVKRDFRWYEVLSRMMLEVVNEYSPKVEYYSIDEFFFEPHLERGQDEQAYVELIRDRIMERVKIPATVGVGRTKTLAKLISDTAKPFGARAVLGTDAERALLAATPVTEMSGIAGRRAARLSPWGVSTCLDMAKADRRIIRRLLTASGEALWWELNGDQVLPIHPKRIPHKTLSRGGSFGEATGDPSVLWAWLVRNVERLVEELEYHGVTTGHVSLWVGYRDGRAGEGRANLPGPSDRFDVLLEALRPCLRQAWIPKGLAGRMHLFADDLRPKGERQLTLFEGASEKVKSVAALKKSINDRQGRFAVRSGATLPLAGIYADGAHSYDICDVRGKTCF
ncbi:DNA polymerase Y family protein [Paludisphaera soli]|uniref:DNA polymerase Y family protein n=1 Tax=Paludisphaera soli TaxID=2712865 RepID=UPI001F0E9D79|nr:nucleotidyltransferase [Paludisphaera soli]